MGPDVSVILPVFNRAELIARAVDSALSQTIKNVEVIVVDDGSTDETPSVVSGMSDSRIRYIRHGKQKYSAAARNTGFRAAKGRYIAFLDSDDEWYPDKLERQLSLLDSQDNVWACVYGGARVFKDGSKDPVESRACYSGDVLLSYLVGDFVIWTPTFMFRRDCIESIGFMDESLLRGQDRDFFIRLLLNYRLAAIEEPVANIYLQTKHKDADQALESRFALLSKYDGLLQGYGDSVRRKAYAVQWMRQADQFLLEGRRAEGMGCAIRAISTFPRLPPRRYVSILAKLFCARRKYRY